MTYETITVEEQNGIATIWLDRPDVRNAFDEVMISELIEVFNSLQDHEEVRLIVLRGKGKNFCAGADLNWMSEVVDYSYEQNYAESLNLSKCFYAIYTSSKPTIAVVHGASIGGANGLLAACDIVVAEENTIFSLSEVKIGIVPACISPYILKRVGEFTARELMLTGKRFNGKEALQYRLVNYAPAPQDVEICLSELVQQFLTSGPKAVMLCKQLLDNVSNHWTLNEAYEKTAAMIAEIRSSDEGQEGMAAFLGKRKPNWVK